MTPGPLERALICDLRAWGVMSGVLAETALRVAQALDDGNVDLVDGSRELRQLVKAIRDANPGGGDSEAARLLEAVNVDAFRR